MHALPRGVEPACLAIALLFAVTGCGGAASAPTASQASVKPAAASASPAASPPSSGAPASAKPNASAGLVPLAQPVEFKFRTGFTPSLQYGMDYAAQQLFWPQLGLKGTTLPGTGSGATVQTVGSGAEQMGMASIDVVLNGILQNVPITILGVVQQRDPNGIIFTSKAGIKDWKDLEDKTVGAFPSSAGIVSVKAAMQLKGVNLDKVHFVNITPGQEMGLMTNGKLDIISATTHAQDVWLRCKGVQASNLTNWDAGVRTYGSLLIANTNWMKTVGDDVVSRAVLGVFQGAVLLKKDPQQVLEVMQKLQPNSPTDRAQELAGVHPDGYVYWSFEDASLKDNGWGWIDPQRLQASADLYTKLGVLKGSIDTSKVFTSKYLEQPAIKAAAMEWGSTPWAQVPADVRQQCGLS